jgi:hypothetical protein
MEAESSTARIECIAFSGILRRVFGRVPDFFRVGG